MENTTKKYGKTLCFLPMISYLAWVIYYAIIAGKNATPQSFDHINVVTNTILNYDSLAIGLALASIVTATLLIYFIVHIARLVQMNEFTKIGWIIFMTFLAPIAFIVFWYAELSKEPSEIDVYPTIA